MNLLRITFSYFEVIIAKIRGVIYNSLWHYLQTETIGKLRDEFQIWKETTIADEPEIHYEETTAPSFMKKIFSSSQEVNNKSEIDNYLNENILSETADVYAWWRKNQKSFPILSRIARKYLSIPATSVPSERLFSDAGNQITSKRSRLSPEIM